MFLWSTFIPNGELMIHMGEEKKQLNQFGRFLDFPGAAIYVFENKESWRQEVYWELPGRPYFSQLRSWTKRKWCISQPQLTTRPSNTCFWHHFSMRMTCFLMESVHIEHCFVQRSLLIFGVKERGDSFSCFERIRGTGCPESPLSNKSRALGGVQGGRRSSTY